MASEAAKEYKSSLDELTFNSKLHINVLTMLAEENVKYAENIVAVIENHITKAPPDKKLPTLYLMDSIMKNLRSSSYSKIFAHNIVSIFGAVFEKVDEKKRQSMYKLRQTWNEIFPRSRLYGLDVRINRIDPAWPITAAAPDTPSSIHVNPKFLTPAKEEVPAASSVEVKPSAEPSEDWSEQQNMPGEEEERLRRELEEEEARRQRDAQRKKQDEQEQRKKWEEEQERKMRDELLAKQQELMRLQQQRLELELEETRRALLEKEKELKRKEQEDSKTAREEEAERRRKEELAKIKAEEEMRKQMEAEIRRKTEEHMRHRQELERRKTEEQKRRAEGEASSKRDPRIRASQAKAAKDATGSPSAKTGPPANPNTKGRKDNPDKGGASRNSLSPVKRTREPKHRAESTDKAKGSPPEMDTEEADKICPVPEETRVESGPEVKGHKPDEPKQEVEKRPHGQSRETSASRTKTPSFPANKEEVDKFGRLLRRGRSGDTKSAKSSSSRGATKSSKDREPDSRKRSVQEGSSPRNASSRSSKFKDGDRDRSRRPRNYRPHRLSKSPSSEEEPFSVRPRQESPARRTRSTRNQRSTTGSQSPDNQVKRSRQDNERKEPRSSKTTSESYDSPRTADRDESGPKLYKKRHSSDVFPEDKNTDTPPLKKIKDENVAESSETNKTEKISNDLADLFGSEDVDYRKLNKSPFPIKPLLGRPDFSSPQQKGWAKFKENRPEEFPFQQPRRISMDSVDMKCGRPPPLLSPPILSTPVLGGGAGGLALGEGGISPRFISLEGISAITRQADMQLQQGKMSQLQHRELMMQLHELQRLQTLMSNIRHTKKQQQRSWDSTSSMEVSGGEDLTSPPFEKRRMPLLQSPASPVASDHQKVETKVPLLDTPRSANETHQESQKSPPQFYDQTPEGKERLTNKPLLEPPPRPALLDSPRKTLLSLPPEASLNLKKEELKFTDRPPLRDMPRDSSFTRDAPNDAPVNRDPTKDAFLNKDVHADALANTEDASFRRDGPKAPSFNRNIPNEASFNRDIPEDHSFKRELTEDPSFNRKFEGPKENRFQRNQSERKFNPDGFQEGHYRQDFRNRYQPNENIRKIPYNETKYYVPEFDPRWSCRQNSYKNERDSLNMCELVLDGRKYELRIGSSKMLRWPKGQSNRVLIDPDTREVFINNKVYTRMGVGERSVMISGREHSIHVQGLQRKFWIDGHYFELRMDAPAEPVSINGIEHDMRLDTSKGKVFLDGRFLCKINFDRPQKIKIDGVERTLDFNPPARTILIDGKSCSLNLSKKYPSVTIGSKEHGVRFDGLEREVIINKEVFLVSTQKPILRKIGEKGKPYFIAFGGPGHELIIDEKWYEVKFNGPEVKLQIGYKILFVQIKGTAPEVKILGEIKTPDEITHINFDEAKADAFRRGEEDMLEEGPLNPFHNRKEEEEGEEQIFFPGKPIEPPPGGPKGIKLEGGDMGPRFGPRSGPRPRPPLPHGLRPPFRMRPPPPPIPPMGLMRPGMPRPRIPPPPPPPFLPRRGEGPGVRPRPPVPSLVDMVLPPRKPLPNEQVPLGLPEARDSQGPANAEVNVNVNDLFAKLVTAGIIRRKSTDAVGVKSHAQADAASSEAKQAPSSGSASMGVGHMLKHLMGVSAASPDPVEKEPVKAEPMDESKESVAESKEPMAESKESEEVPVVEDVKSEPVPDLTDLQLDIMKVKYSSVVHRLYIGLQCNSCGTRFKDGQTDKYKEHLDWHFRQNKREKVDSRVVRNRRWYYSISDWVEFEEVGDLEERIVSNYFENMLASIHQVIGTAEGEVATVENAESCPQASTCDEDNVCVICGDPFEQFYDDEEEEWHLRDAVRVEDKTYHPVCYEDAKNDLGSHSLLETPQASRSESRVEEGGADLPNPISNPLAYLTALSQKAKETSQPIDALAKMATKTEAVQVAVKSEPVDSVSETTVMDKVTVKSEVVENVAVKLETIEKVPEKLSVKTEPMEEAPLRGSGTSVGMRSVASEPCISKTFSVASPQAAAAVVNEEKQGDVDSDKKGMKTVLSEEDRIVLGFKSTNSQEASKGAIAAAIPVVRGEVSSVTKSDPRLAAREVNEVGETGGGEKGEKTEVKDSKPQS